MADWQIEKSRLNHGWIQNGILVQLRQEANCPATLEDVYSWKATLEEWRVHSIEIKELIERFIPAESPQNMLAQAPLSRLADSDRRWLAKVVHECWLKRTLATSFVLQALEAFQLCKENYEELAASVSVLVEAPGNRSQAASDQELQVQDDRYSEMGKNIQKFAKSVYVLSDTISKFPFNAKFK